MRADLSLPNPVAERRADRTNYTFDSVRVEHRDSGEVVVYLPHSSDDWELIAPGPGEAAGALLEVRLELDAVSRWLSHISIGTLEWPRESVTCADCGIDYEPDPDQIGMTNERCPDCEQKGSGE